MKNKLTNKLFAKVENVNKSVLKQYLLIFAIWLLISIGLLTLFILYAYELNNLNHVVVTFDGTSKTVLQWKAEIYTYELTEQQKIYKAMVETVFGSGKVTTGAAFSMPIIWFSNMLFIPQFQMTSDWKAAWDSKMLQITTGQVYMLVALICAVIGLVLYLITIAEYDLKIRQSKKKGLTNKYPLYTNNYSLFTMKTYINFVIAVAIFFSFYELGVTALMLIYMIVIKQIYKTLEAINKKNDISSNIFSTNDLSYFGLLFAVMGVMIGYNFLSSFFMKWLNVDIKVALDALFSTGGIAVVIVGLVKNLLSSSITEVKKKMRNIDKQIEQVRFFYRVRQEQAPFDFEYAQILPPIIKSYISRVKTVNPAELKTQFDKLFEFTDFIKNFNFGKKKQNKRRNFILYRTYNEIKSFAELEDIKVNLIKEFNI